MHLLSSVGMGLEAEKAGWPGDLKLFYVGFAQLLHMLLDVGVCMR